MRKILLFTLVLGGCLTQKVQGQCTANEDEIIVQIVPDNYPEEISWTLTNAQNTLLAQGTSNSDTFCVDTGQCLTFTIYDSYGDGLNSSGFYSVYQNNILVRTGSGNYGNNQATSFNCPAGYACLNPIVVDTGVFNSPNPNAWYTFVPDTNGRYEISTCYPENTCNTTIWMYDNCGALIGETYTGTIFHNDDNTACGSKAIVSAALAAGNTYLIRIGDHQDACASTPNIKWSVQYQGPISGCTDPNSCNYNPLATVSDTCYTAPHPACGGPDLTVDQNALTSSLYMDDVEATNDACEVVEGCLNGYGTRRVLRFDTRIENIGVQDYYIGDPLNNPDQFNFTNCHGHAHYDGYASYVLIKEDGSNVPIGRKNGFCVIDLDCPIGINAQYGCGNMGITAGCADIYNSGISCQWIDVTDVDTGNYILGVVVNWDYAPDGLGRHETRYDNNWAQVCINIAVDGTGQKYHTVLPNCTPYVDCAGNPNGNAKRDCNGDCNGSVLKGDINASGQRDTADVTNYVANILSDFLAPSPCTDVNETQSITVWDAAQVLNCALYSQSNEMACVFPRNIVNTDQVNTFKLHNLNLDEQYVDVMVLNPQSRILAYELSVSGIEITNVQALTPSAYDVDISHSTYKIIGISKVDSVLERSSEYQPLCRVYFNYIGQNELCISEVKEVVNEHYEATAKVKDNACFNISPLSNRAIQSIDLLGVQVYPNPAHENMEIQFRGSINQEIQLEVINALGQTMQHMVVAKHKKSQTIPTANLPSGNYWLRLMSAEEIKTVSISIKH